MAPLAHVAARAGPVGQSNALGHRVPDARWDNLLKVAQRKGRFEASRCRCLLRCGTRQHSAG